MSLFGLTGLPGANGESLYFLRSNLVLLTVSALGATPWPRRLYEKVSKSPVFTVLEPIALMLLLLVCTAYLVDGSFNPFLYFRF